MKHLIVVLIAFVTGIASAADKPNFSGDWQLDLAKSEYGTIPPPTALSRKITHNESSLTIEDKQQGGYGGDSTSTRMVTIDGKPHTVQSRGVEAESTVRWDSSALLSTTLVKSRELTYEEKVTLSDDGKVMNSTVEVSSPQGSVEIFMVFNRQ